MRASKAKVAAADIDDQVQASLRALEGMPLPQLRTYWSQRWGDVPAYRTRDQILRAAAWKLQADAFGGVSARVRRELGAMGAKFVADRAFSPISSVPLLPGTTLVREWAGKRHEVAVHADGFVYDSRRFKSLSAVAVAIAGTQWNGPVFFGVKPRKAPRKVGAT